MAGILSTIVVMMLLVSGARSALAAVDDIYIVNHLDTHIEEAFVRIKRFAEENPRRSAQLLDATERYVATVDSPHLQAKSRYLLAYTYNLASHHDDAVRACIKALELNFASNDLSLAVDIHVLLADAYRTRKNFKEADSHLTDARKLATRIGDRERLSDIDLVSGHRWAQVKNYEKAQQFYRTSASLADQVGRPEKVALAYRYLAQTYKNIEDFESSVFFNNKALQYLTSPSDRFYRAIVLDYQSDSQRKLGRYGPALENASQALQIFREFGNQYRIGKALNNLTIIRRKLGNYDGALAYANELLNLREQVNDFKGIAAISKEIGLIYYHLGQKDNAKRFYEKTLSIDPQYVKARDRASAYQQLAILLKEDKNFPLALEYAQHAKALVSNKTYVSTVERIIGEIYQDMGEIKRALAAYQKSLVLSREVGAKWNEATALLKLGGLQTLTMPAQSIESLDMALSLATDLSATALMKDAYSSLLEAYKKLGNVGQALDYSIKYAQIIQDISREEVNKNIAELAILREVDQREREVDALRKQAKIADLELSKQTTELEILEQNNTINALSLQKERFMRMLLIGSMVIVILALALVTFRYRFERKSQELLADKTAQVEEKNKKLENMNKSKDRLFSLIAHDLRNPVSVMVSLSENLDSALAADDIPAATKTAAAIHSSSMETHKLLDQMLAWALSQLRDTDPVPRQHRVYGICDDVIQTLSPIALDKSVVVINNIDRNAQFFADGNMIAAVIRNLLGNALKFTPHEGRIELFSDQQEDKLFIHVKDSGVGISNEAITHILNSDFHPSTPGVDKEQGMGFGLVLCKEFLVKNGGELLIARNDVGSDFYFYVPAVRSAKALS